MADGCELRLEEPVEEAIAGRIQAAPGEEHAAHLECAVCKNTAHECPVKTPCGHYFHEGCLGPRLNGKTGKARSCPRCHKQLPAGKGAYAEADREVKATLDAMRVACPQDCGEPQAKRMRFDGLAKHIRKECPLTPLACTGADCGKVLPRKEMEGAHLGICEHVLVPCGQCEEKIKRGILQDHKAESCPRRPITCAYCKKQKLLYCDKEKHELECTGPVQMRAVAELRQQNRELQAAMAKQQAEHSAKLATVDFMLRTIPRVLDCPPQVPCRGWAASSGCGLMFDLESKGLPVAVTALWIPSDREWGTWEIWVRAAEGSYRDQQGPEGWELLGSGVHGKEKKPHRSPMRCPVPIAPGGRRAFYIHSSNQGVVLEPNADAYADAEDCAIAVRPGAWGDSKTMWEVDKDDHGKSGFVGRVEYTFL